jgi:hypothetical protein
MEVLEKIASLKYAIICKLKKIEKLSFTLEQFYG